MSDIHRRLENRKSDIEGPVSLCLVLDLAEASAL
jgi:hypothetical protein